jgi:Trp operon repressor
MLGWIDRYEDIINYALSADRRDSLACRSYIVAQHLQAGLETSYVAAELGSVEQVRCNSPILRLG